MKRDSRTRKLKHYQARLQTFASLPTLKCSLKLLSSLCQCHTRTNASSSTKYRIFEVREREGFKTIERPFAQISQRVVTPAAICCQSK